MNDKTKPPAPAPEAAKPAPKAPTKAAAKLCAAMMATGMVMVACVHVSTGTAAGDCSFAPTYEVPAPSPDYARDIVRNHAPLHETVLAGGSKLRIPPEMAVRLDASNPEGKCKPQMTKSEPCPIWEGRIVLEVDDSLWGGMRKSSLLIGETHIIPAKETREEVTPANIRGLPPMRTIGRMTALITHLQTPDGTKWPVCGVLYGYDGQVGVQILAPEYYGPSSGAAWGQAKVRFFWPP